MLPITPVYVFTKLTQIELFLTNRINGFSPMSEVFWNVSPGYNLDAVPVS